MHIKQKTISIKKMVELAVLGFGLAFVSTLQTSNMSSVFKFLGVDNTSMPFLWLAAPLAGLLIQPVIGQLSDDTCSRYGKRRPYIVVWGTLAAIAFCLLALFNTLMMTVIFIWIVHCSINGCTEGLRALIGDVVPDKQRAKAFALQAILAGAGAAIGAGLPYMIDKIYLYIAQHDIAVQTHAVPLNLKLSFVVGGLVLLASMLITVKKVREKPYTHTELLKRKHRKTSVLHKTFKLFRELYYSTAKMPRAFRGICLVHFTTWLGVFIFWLYFTLVLAQNIYHMPFNATGNSVHDAELLQHATLDSSMYNAIYQYVSLGYAALLFFISSKLQPKILHAFALIVGGLGFLIISFATNSYMLIAAMVGVGILWGSMLVLPYTIAISSLPKGKLGVYLGLFNIAITLPQILCSLFLGVIYSYLFKSHAWLMLVLAGILILCSAVMLWWQYRADFKQQLMMAKLALPTIVIINPEPAASGQVNSAAPVQTQQPPVEKPVPKSVKNRWLKGFHWM